MWAVVLPSVAPPCLSNITHTCRSRSLLMFTMENCFYLLISQAVRYLRDPAVHPRDKQRMKQELSSELVWM